MSVPPPGPHGQQPDPYGQQPGHGQPSGGFPQQPQPQQFGQPQQQGYGQQGYGQPGHGQPGHGQQPGQFGQPGPFEQAGQYGQPGQYAQHGQPGQYGRQPGMPGQFGFDPSGGLPPGKKSALPWVLGGVGVLAVVGLVVGLLVFTGDDKTDTASGGSDQSTPASSSGQAGGSAETAEAEKVVDAYVAELEKGKSADKAKSQAMICAADRPTVKAFAEQAEAVEASLPAERREQLNSVKLDYSVENVTASGTTGSLTMRVKYSNVPAGVALPAESTTALELVKESGDWKICGLAKQLTGNPGGATG
ncbi:DUF4878 domain-containing protein [Actinosynnema pretiosum subsp. pretiosum]|uniref:DUF4878 domain-containing protein n=1 Tax=Actinosynnema pretiosum subsp. pretiosum TaxID=103721 RepID=A0AA45L9K6_9PSEU|nr:hypothetical protein APASM_2261 [Actinosynnema pretiosum subsp. pretiosum]QUF06144.1 DUF4878 domain-containing protein [Actinosynnema pretiosum subsp. pretiosum]